MPGARLKSKRLGRGIGSGKGKTSGKGVKGQKARERRGAERLRGRPDADLPPAAEARLHQHVPQGIRAGEPRRAGGGDRGRASIDASAADHRGRRCARPGWCVRPAGRRAAAGAMARSTRAITITVSGASAAAKAAVEKAGGTVTTTVAVTEARRLMRNRSRLRREAVEALGADGCSGDRVGAQQLRAGADHRSLGAPRRPHPARSAAQADVARESHMASAAEQLAANLNLGVFSKATELKKRIWFTLGALIVYRLGTYIPVPGVDASVMAEMLQPARRRHPGHVRHVHRRRAAAHDRVRPEHHALHQRQHHHPVDDRRRSRRWRR